MPWGSYAVQDRLIPNPAAAIIGSKMAGHEPSCVPAREPSRHWRQRQDGVIATGQLGAGLAHLSSSPGAQAVEHTEVERATNRRCEPGIWTSPP